MGLRFCPHAISFLSKPLTSLSVILGARAVLSLEQILDFAASSGPVMHDAASTAHQRHSIKNEETIVNHPASTTATLTTQPAQSAQAERPSALWVLAAAFVVIAIAVLVADASLTPEQRFAVFLQSGTFP